jgi:site-specific DNA-methyltransferase (adenine-specific)
MSNDSTIIWKETKIKVKDLDNYKLNPRQINKVNFDKLVLSLKKNGYHQRMLVDTDNTIIDGHHRKEAFLEAGYNANDEIEVLKPNRKLTEEEFKRINVQSNVQFADWDIDALANDFEISELVDWGVNKDLFQDLVTKDFKEEEFNETDRLDQTKEKMVKCPACGHEFTG